MSQHKENPGPKDSVNHQENEPEEEIFHLELDFPYDPGNNNDSKSQAVLELENDVCEDENARKTLNTFFKNNAKFQDIDFSLSSLHCILETMRKVKHKNTRNTSFNSLVIKQYLETGPRAVALIRQYSIRAKWMFLIHSMFMKLNIAIDPTYDRLQHNLTNMLLSPKNDSPLSEPDLVDRCMNDMYVAIYSSYDYEQFIYSYGKDRSAAKFSGMIAIIRDNFFIRENDALKGPPMDKVMEEGVPFICYAKPNVVGSEVKTNVYSENGWSSCGVTPKLHRRFSLNNKEYIPRFGEIYFNRYITIQELGSGGYAVVWNCWDILKKHFVAMKFVTASRFDQGMEFLVHHHVNQKTSDYFTYMKDVYILCVDKIHVICTVISPICEDFSEVFPSDKFLSNHNLFKRVSKRLIKGFDFLHRRCDVIHGDVKPSNFLVEKPLSKVLKSAISSCDFNLLYHYNTVDNCPANYVEQINLVCVVREIGYYSNQFLSRLVRSPNYRRIVISDFGLAWVSSDPAKVICGGTRKYCPPEYFDNAIPDFKMDVWSLGCAFYEFVSGNLLDGGQLRLLAYNASLSGSIDELDLGSEEFDLLSYINVAHRKQTVAIAKKMKYCAWPKNDIIVVANLIAGMLLNDPSLRLSFKQCLSHQWFHST